jgi:hypothetical protein
VLAILSGLAVTACGPAGPDPAPPEPAATTAEPAAAPQPVTTATGTVAEPDGLGIAFDQGAGLQLRSCDGGTPRCVVLSDPAAEPHLLDLVTVQVFDGPLEAVAASEAGFERNAEGRLMTTYGRFEPVAVERFEVDGKPGLRAVITCGISDPETGFHAAAGECLWAVVSEGARSVVILSSGYPNGLEAAGPVVSSLRFLPTR